MPDLLADVLEGNVQAAARLISLVEDGDPEGYEMLRRLHGRTGRAYVVGVTGPPGAGKSTLVDTLTKMLRAEGATVAVVAVDPTSPFTGGALLGDRIRMQDHATDPGVFIRSMATRGSLGGLAPTTTDVVRVLDAIGYDLIFVETVGTGQAEVDVVRAADSVVIVLVPGLGDTVQTMKAGIMEIGEIFVVNKADQGDADRTITEVQMMLALNPRTGAWQPPVLRAVATTGQGVDEVRKAIDAHRSAQEATGALPERRTRRRRDEILRLVELRARDRALDAARRSGRLDELTAQVVAGTLDPHAAAEEILKGGGGMTGGILRGGKLDHVGIAVSDLQAAERLYTAALGGRVVSREELAGDRVRITFIDAGGALFELLTPTGDDGPLARFLKSRGEGLHHLAFEVADLQTALRDAVANGMSVVDEHPRSGARGRLIAFLHPTAARGVLVELVQPPSP